MSAPQEVIDVVCREYNRLLYKWTLVCQKKGFVLPSGRTPTKEQLDEYKKRIDVLEAWLKQERIRAVENASRACE